AEYRALKRAEISNTQAQNDKAETKAPVQAASGGLTNTEKNEMRKLEKEIASAETKKATILDKFNSSALDPEEAAKLSTELGDLQELLDTKEMRWLELAEKAS
ncbi:MAG: ABC transporter ATP-binding protein, partial [Saprospiraceae bacterium]|nr:ABC transporter ATP-binding protein [Saprospiraceae bacterium]